MSIFDGNPYDNRVSNKGGIMTQPNPIVVTEIPDCDPCKYHLGETEPAYAYAMPAAGRGSSKWYYFCKGHFTSNRCRLGNYGRELVKR
jgi:hypothetical protein